MSKRMRGLRSECTAMIRGVTDRCAQAGRRVKRGGRVGSIHGTHSVRSTRVLRIGIDIGGSSVKAAALRDGAVEWTARSGTYQRPGRAQLDAAIAEALARLQEKPDAVGVCVPGLLDETRSTVMHSV